MGQLESCLLTTRRMAIIIVISTADFKIRWDVLSLSFSERESRKWPLGLSDFYHNYLLSNDIAFSTLERYPFATTN